MNTAGRFWASVAADATRERELLKEALHSCHRNARIVRLSLDSFGGSDQFSVDSGIQFSGLRRNMFLFRRFILFCRLQLF
jgi:hypothetical protein